MEDVLLITFGSHRKLDPGRRCPRQPHIVNKEGRSYAVTNPWWRWPRHVETEEGMPVGVRLTLTELRG